MIKKLLYGIPELTSEHGEMVDLMLLFVTVVMAVLLVFWSTFIVVAIWRFRQKKNPKASYLGIQNHWYSHVEIGVVIIEAVLLIGFAFPLWGKRVDEIPVHDGVVRIRAVAEKFAWTFHYPGEDGLFGRTSPRLISGTNNIGIDPKDPNSADDILSKNIMRIPVHTDIVVEISSKDVIHNLHLYTMRIAQDATPGTESHITFKATKTNSEDGWDILCGQLCGPGHANMAAKLYVDEKPAYEEWLKGEKTFSETAAPVVPVTASVSYIGEDTDS